MADPCIQSASNFVPGFTGNPCPVSFGSANTSGNTLVVTVWNRTNPVVPPIVDTNNTPTGGVYILEGTQGSTDPIFYGVD